MQGHDDEITGLGLHGFECQLLWSSIQGGAHEALIMSMPSMLMTRAAKRNCNRANQSHRHLFS